MNAFTRRCAGLVVILSTLFASARPARADEIQNKVIGVTVGVVAGLVAATVIIIVLVKHKLSITGCVAQGSGGLTLQNEGDNKTYVLQGDVAGVTPGQRVKLQGKRHKGEASQFDVSQVKKNYGACPAHS